MQIVDLHIERLAYGGDGIARPTDGPVTFVPRTAPGDHVRARIVETAKRHQRAEVVELLEGGPERVEPPCPYYSACGGCQLQHIAVDAQRRAKAEQIEDALARIGRVEASLSAPLWSGLPTRYRNKVTLHTRGGPWGLVARDPQAIVEIDSCLLLTERLDHLSQHARKKIQSGTELMARTLHTGDSQVVTDGECEDWAALGATSVWQDGAHVFGSEHVTHESAGIRLELGPRSFAQVNDTGGAALVDAVVAEAALTGHETVLDLFSGVGVYALALAPSATRVVAVEADPTSAAIAERLAREANYDHVESRAGRVEQVIGDLADADVVVLDPPRRGLAGGVTRALASSSVKKIIYVSCNPTTLARDIARLRPQYRVVRVLGFDLFPQTHHIETVVTLVR